MIKQSGPAFRQQAVPLAKCPGCQGSGFIQGVFHQMVCADCEGSGIVHGESGESLPLQDLVVQLRLRLNRAKDVIRDQRRMIKQNINESTARGYGVEGRGPGGTNWTGD